MGLVNFGHSLDSFVSSARVAQFYTRVYFITTFGWELQIIILTNYNLSVSDCRNLLIYYIRASFRIFPTHN